MADPFDSIFQQDMARNTVPEDGSDRFWGSLWKATGNAAKETFGAGSGGLMYKPRSVQGLSTGGGGGGYAKQAEARGAKAPGAADYENFLIMWESRMSRFTRSYRFASNTTKD